MKIINIELVNHKNYVFKNQNTDYLISWIIKMFKFL